LKLLRDGFKPNLTRHQKQQLMIRLARQFPNEEVYLEGDDGERISPPRSINPRLFQ